MPSDSQPRRSPPLWSLGWARACGNISVDYATRLHVGFVTLANTRYIDDLIIVLALYVMYM